MIRIRPPLVPVTFLPNFGPLYGLRVGRVRNREAHFDGDLFSPQCAASEASGSAAGSRFRDMRNPLWQRIADLAAWID
jgi:hypothetical protein